MIGSTEKDGSYYWIIEFLFGYVVSIKGSPLISYLSHTYLRHFSVALQFKLGVSLNVKQQTVWVSVVYVGCCNLSSLET